MNDHEFKYRNKFFEQVKKNRNPYFKEIHIYSPQQSNFENSNQIQLTAKDILRINIYKKIKADHRYHFQYYSHVNQFNIMNLQNF